MIIVDFHRRHQAAHHNSKTCHHGFVMPRTDNNAGLIRVGELLERKDITYIGEWFMAAKTGSLIYA
ncbi:MAG: hypothetical protein ACI9KN_000560 [Gammaproteobacteria bacterium]|jgi:hypothetical protein